MKKDIHPKYEEMTIVCACGGQYPTMNTVPGLRVEICSNCHPFFTGKQKFIDSAGRVEKFKKKYGIAKAEEAVETAEMLEIAEAV